MLLFAFLLNQNMKYILKPCFKMKQEHTKNIADRKLKSHVATACWGRFIYYSKPKYIHN